jgi:hypothetical protein
MNVFDEDVAPYDVSGSGRKIAFINGTSMKQFGYLTREEWLKGEYLRKYSQRYEDSKKRIENKQKGLT